MDAGWSPVTLRLEAFGMTVEPGPFLRDVPLDTETVALVTQTGTVVLVGTLDQLLDVAAGLDQLLDGMG